MNINEKILALKKEKNACILAHFYQPFEIQQLADIVGDSLELARKSKHTNADILVFCGVSFMGESAALLCPDKRVLVPAPNAGCYMADTITPDVIKTLKKKHPGSAVVCYINSTAATKAECDICCTSSNAIKVVNSLDEERIIFVPDKNLGEYIAEQIPNKKFFFHEKGCCCIHDGLKPQAVLECKKQHSEALVLVHPECNKAVREMADFIGSTAQIISFCETNDKKEFIICTEQGVTERMMAFMPDKSFYIPDKVQLYCDRMKMITKEMILNTLENEKNEVVVDESIREAALKTMERMLNI